MSRSYRKSPINYIELPIFSKRMSNRKFRRTSVIDEDNTESSVAAYRRLGGYDQWDVRGWRSRYSEREFKDDYLSKNGREANDSELYSDWGYWYRRK